MSGQGAPNLRVDGTGLTVEIVASSWHDEVMDGLIAGAIGACEEAGASYRLTRVPGCFELPIVAEALARQGASIVVALGVVIKGGTPHFEYVSSAVTRGLGDVARSHAIAVGFGVLTCDTEQQAKDRAGLPESSENKGKEAAEAAMDVARTLSSLA